VAASAVRYPWSINGRLAEPVHFLEAAFERMLIQAEGEHADREGLIDTPERAARAWRELTSGYGARLDLSTFDADGYDELVAITRLPFYSLCEHHLLPFHGTADFVYLPDERILGLSKFARLLDQRSRRLQVQERLSSELASALEGALNPRGVMVVVRAEHLCMAMRGVQRPGHTTITSVVRGVFATQPEARAEAQALLA